MENYLLNKVQRFVIKQMDKQVRKEEAEIRKELGL